MSFLEYGDTKPAMLIKAALDRVVALGSVFEVRIPKTKVGTISGYFDDTTIAAKCIAKENGKHQAIYITANPVNQALLARCDNRLEYGSFITSNDADIAKRRWFLLDFDPIRPAGISSSDEEMDITREKADEVVEWLTSLGWPEPMIASSGNGIHVMYRTDDPNDDAARIDYEYALKMLSSLFSDSKVKLDVVMYNASRVWKVYGTIAAKGSSTETRPHRVAMIYSVPKDIQILSRDLIGGMASPLRDAKAEEYQDMTGEYIVDMEKWLTERGQTVVSGPRPMFGSEGQKWIISACPFNPDHQNPMVGLVNNRPVFKCLHDSCSGFKWKNFREKIDPGYRDPDLVYGRLRDWCMGDDQKLDGELAQSAAALGKKFKETMVKLKKEVPKARALLLEDETKKEQKRFQRETIGENNEKGNVVGLINRVRLLQQDGSAPMFWIAEHDHRIRSGDLGDIDAPKVDETHEINLLVKFHSMGDTWVKQIHMGQVIKFVAQEYRINPLKRMLKQYVWDGTKRLSSWLPDLMGTKDTDYTRAIGRKWLISAVARAMEPGCQADHMLIFEGAQGIGKSQALRALGDRFYTEYSGGVTGSGTVHKDMVAVISGKMIVEMSELATVRRAEIEALKAVLTTTVDDARLSYERDAKAYPRTCVFAGTTNEVGQAYIADLTGVRRFWPTHVGEIRPPNIPLLKEVRDQLWAEAVHAYENGEDWYTVPAADVAEEQASRQITVELSDPWYERIRESLTNPDSYSEEIYHLIPEYLAGEPIPGKFKLRLGRMHTIMGVLLQIDVSRQSNLDLIRLTRVYKAMGFKKVRPGKSWTEGTWAYDMTESAMPHLWSSIVNAAKSQKFPKHQEDLQG